MANLNTLKNDLVKKEQNNVKVGATVKSLLAGPEMKKRFDDVLKDKAPQFMSSLINLVNGNQDLKKIEPMSIIQSAMIAATLDLSIDKNLGQAWIVPYKGKSQMQLGYKGYIQLAQRSGQYKKMTVNNVYKGELVKWNRFDETLEIDETLRESDEVIGYHAKFELVNGFIKEAYWSKEEVIKHKNRFSKTDFVWKTDFDAMAQKTVLKNLISKWGPLSIEMQQALRTDSSIPNEKILEKDGVNNDDSFDFVETEFEEESQEVDPETGEIIPENLGEN